MAPEEISDGFVMYVYLLINTVKSSIVQTRCALWLQCFRIGVLNTAFSDKGVRCVVCFFDSNSSLIYFDP